MALSSINIPFSSFSPNLGFIVDVSVRLADLLAIFASYISTRTVNEDAGSKHFLSLSMVVFGSSHVGTAVSLLVGLTRAAAAPSGFPSSGNGLWYNSTGTIWSRHFLPVGNGFLAATTPGGSVQETTQLNVESLWSGGPFVDPVGATSELILRNLAEVWVTRTITAVIRSRTNKLQWCKPCKGIVRRYSKQRTGRSQVRYPLRESFAHAKTVHRR